MVDPYIVRNIIEFAQLPVILVAVGTALFQTLKNTFRYLSKDKQETHAFEEILELKARLVVLESQTHSGQLSNDERKDVVDRFTDQLASQEFAKIRDALQSSFSRDSAVKVIRGLYTSSISRLRSEVEAQDRRSNVNLLIGIGMALSGIIALIFFIFQQSSVAIGSKEALIFSFVPQFLVRISLVILIEVFSYFFLRLYRSGMGEIKYFQNELTNVEFRILALELSIANDNQKTAEKFIMELMRTERNFLLKKGDKTIGLATDEQAAKADRHFSNLIDKVVARLGASQR